MDVKAGDAGRVCAEWTLGPEPTPYVDSWIERAKAGDPAAFDRVMQAQQALVYRTALALTGNHEDALDVTQEVFLRLYRYLANYDASKPLEPWLYRMAVNAARDHLRKGRRQAWLAKVGLRRGEVEAPRAVASLGTEERTLMLRKWLQRLPEKERRAIVLRDVEGLPTKEVARVLGSSEVTVRSQISRARLKMRRYRAEWQEKNDEM